MKILLLDNYDSFTYNLYHYVESLGNHRIDVCRNDEIGLESVKKYDKIILSPGPALPKNAGILLDLLKEYASSKSILGVCLGHQAIAESFGGSLKNLDAVVHGMAKTLKITDPNDLLYKDLPNTFKVGRYHSWVVEKSSLPKEFIISAEDELGEIMSFYHTRYDLRGIQFHPESVLTEYGREMIRNWVEY